MQCPSCKHSQTGGLECERCGIIFEKYRLRQERLAAKELAWQEEVAQKSSKKGVPGIVMGLAIGLLIGGGAFFFLGKGEEKAAAPIADLSRQIQKETPVASPTNRQRSRPAVTAPIMQQDDGLEGLAKQLAEKYPTDTPIEKACNATVFIKTSWGSGSGFFVSKNGMIITNRHVLQMQNKDVDSFNRQLRKGEQALTREAKTLRYLHKQLPMVRDQDMHQQLKEDIRTRKREYVKYESRLAKLKEKLAEIEASTPTSDAEVILIDGSSYRVDSVQYSDTFDLALISINAYGSPYLRASRGRQNQGQKVYTVGNPSGLTHTVTSGVISGYRKYDGTPLIQTDAPINPGNSGGPLIDEQGMALGVNTLIIRDTEGIGFAIPMKSVFEAFGNYFSQD